MRGRTQERMEELSDFRKSFKAEHCRQPENGGGGRRAPIGNAAISAEGDVKRLLELKMRDCGKAIGRFKPAPHQSDA